MNIANSPYRFYIALAIGTFVIADASSDIVARVSIDDENVFLAAKEHFYYAFSQPIGTAILLLPYLALAWISASLAKRDLIDESKFIFFAGTIAFWTMTALGYRSAQLLMQDGYYTAAIFEVAFLPLEFIPWLLALCFIRYLLVRKRKET